MTQTRTLNEDLDLILQRGSSIWDDFRGARVFITGGTGFFGCWLLEALTYADERLTLGLQVVVLSRNPKNFRSKVPHLAKHASVVLIAGDVRDFAFPDGHFTHVIHAATDAVASTGLGDPLSNLDTIIQGTRRALDFSVYSRASKFLLTSSGAVYGRQAWHTSNVPESCMEAPDPLEPLSVYGEGKRLGELLCSIYHKTHGLEAKIARCFAFVGPYLPLDAHFALGNFIGDALAGNSIVIRGNGSSRRSYMYSADLTIWLLTILVRGRSSRPYNVGSEESIAISDLAKLVRNAVGASVPIVTIARESAGPPSNYVPATTRGQHELGLVAATPLPSAIRKTAIWAANLSKSRD